MLSPPLINLFFFLTVPALPVPISNYHIYGVSSELAIIHWFVPRIAYTPETYYVQYRIDNEERIGLTLMSTIVSGSRNLSSRNVEYEVVLDRLNSGTYYTANIVANNTFGSQISPEISFTTTPLGMNYMFMIS